MKTIWVEILVISAVILIPVSFALRVIYGGRWIEWENSLVESWGFSSVGYSLLKVVVLVGVAGYWLFRQRRRRQKQEAHFYELPKT